MNDYEIRVIPKIDDGGKTYWTAYFPAVKGCVGGGRTCEEAVAEAQENLKFFLEYLEEEGKAVPAGYKDNSFSGKIALRVSKSTHKKLYDMADSEGISMNMLINTILERYIGKKEKENYFDESLDEIRENTAEVLRCQSVNNAITKRIWDTVNGYQTLSIGRVKK